MPDATGDAACLGELRERLLTAVAPLPQDAAALPVRAAVPDAALVNGLCQGLELSPVERLSLLACDTLEARARRLLAVLEFRALERAPGRRSPVH
jgi:hypothetical protein